MKLEVKPSVLYLFFGDCSKAVLDRYKMVGTEAAHQGMFVVELISLKQSLLNWV